MGTVRIQQHDKLKFGIGQWVDNFTKCAILLTDRKTNKSSGNRMHPAESGPAGPDP